MSHEINLKITNVVGVPQGLGKDLCYDMSTSVMF